MISQFIVIVPFTNSILLSYSTFPIPFYQLMPNHSSNQQSNCKTSGQHSSTETTALDKLFRLYSTNNFIRPPKVTSSRPKQINQKAVIQLIFPHPNLLFIHPQTIKDPAQKQAFIQLNMMKNIIQRKQPKCSKIFTSSQTKPMTAPHLGRSKEKNRSLMSFEKDQKEDSVNVCRLTCDKQNSNQDPFSSELSWRKTKTFTSKSKFRKTHMSQKQNQELRNEKEFINKMLSRNTFDFILEEKKKEIFTKYDDDKMVRQELYKKSVKSPTTQMYINIEGKFLKYFKQS